MEIAVKKSGFTLVELIVVVVAILGIIAAFAIPAYKNYVQKTKRAEVQAELAEVAGQLQRFKMANYTFVQSVSGTTITPINLTRLGYSSTTPNSQNGLYQYALSFNAAATSWTLTASPISSGMQKGSGGLTLNSTGQQCWYKGKDSFDASTDTCFGWNEK